MARNVPVLLTRLLALAVTIWLFSHALYIVDESYRATLRLAWSLKHGSPNYTVVLHPQKMAEIHGMKKKDYLENHKSGDGERPWKMVFFTYFSFKIEENLEDTLVHMFQRTDPMKAWELKKIGNTGWQAAARDLKDNWDKKESSPLIKRRNGGSDMTNVLVYNRIPKSGSTLMLSLLYQLGERLNYLVLRGKYHSYRYFNKNDREGLGHFLEQASSRARTVYVQHQYYINFTQFHQEQPIYINLMRDPVEHLISSYFYKRTVILQHRGPGEFTPEERRIMAQPLEECIVERRLECVYYGYTVHRNKTEQLEFRNSWSPHFLYPSDVLVYFCGHDEECTKLGSKEALQKAKYNVDNHFAVVGLLEHMNETMAVLEHRLPRFFKGISKIADTNAVKNRNHIKPKLSDTLIRVMKERLQSEYDLYNHIKQKLFKQYAAITS